MVPATFGQGYVRCQLAMLSILVTFDTPTTTATFGLSRLTRIGAVLQRAVWPLIMLPIQHGRPRDATERAKSFCRIRPAVERPVASWGPAEPQRECLAPPLLP